MELQKKTIVGSHAVVVFLFEKFHASETCQGKRVRKGEKEKERRKDDREGGILASIFAAVSTQHRDGIKTYIASS